MENCDLNKIKQLREWSPLTDLLEKIPAKIQRGLFSYNFNITCVDILPDFIALGTDIGIVLWYNRTSGDLKKLRCEVYKQTMIHNHNTNNKAATKQNNFIAICCLNSL